MRRLMLLCAMCAAFGSVVFTANANAAAVNKWTYGGTNDQAPFSGCVYGVSGATIIVIHGRVGKAPDRVVTTPSGGFDACWDNLDPMGLSNFADAIAEAGGALANGWTETAPLGQLAPKGTGGAGGAPSASPAFQATRYCRANWTVTVLESYSRPLTLTAYFNYPYYLNEYTTRTIPQGVGSVTFALSYMFPGWPDGRTYTQKFLITQTGKAAYTRTQHSWPDPLRSVRCL